MCYIFLFRDSLVMMLTYLLLQILEALFGFIVFEGWFLKVNLYNFAIL